MSEEDVSLICLKTEIRESNHLRLHLELCVNEALRKIYQFGSINEVVRLSIVMRHT